jgi:hypothetical protein
VSATETGGPAPGNLLANAKCTGDADCRSTQCVSGVCVDGCCGAPTCGTGGTCSYKSDAKFVCRTAVGTRGVGSSCSGNSDCTSGYCIEGFFTGTCTKQCCSSEDCPSNWQCNQYKEGANIYGICEPLSFTESAGSLRSGETCARNEDCRSYRCVANVCSDPCCKDANCATGTFCRPKKLSSGESPNRCVKPTAP